MDFHVLGQVDVVGDDGRLRIASGRQLSLLALLLVHANRVLSADRILDELWGDEPPESGAKAVAFHVSRLRDSLAPGRSHEGEGEAGVSILATDPGGYVLRVTPDQVDAVRFERLAAEARALVRDDPAGARVRLEAALGLWRGEPYAQVADEAFARPEISRLEEMRLRALEDLAEADLALGRHADVAERLSPLAAEHPLREHLRGQLAVALYRTGRQAEALRVLADGRAVLSAELGVDPGPELRQLEGRILRQDPRLDPPATRRVVRNPYKGLRPFLEADSADYFGREVLVTRLVERLGQVARAGRFMVVVGPSGSGKSSAVRAGLIPALRAGALPGADRWPFGSMLPGSRPFRQLAVALRDALPDASVGRFDDLDHEGGLRAALAASAPPAAPVLLVIDQLEELFTLVDEAVRGRFVAAIVDALGAPDPRLLVVATLRADYFVHLLRETGLGELVRAGTEIVTSASRDELERAIVRPAGRVGVELEPGLAGEIIVDAGHQPGELPLLQFALTELFERGDGVCLTRADYAAVGGVVGALARRADEALGALDAGDREIARQLFLRLVTLGDAGEPTGRRVDRAELASLTDDPGRLDAMIDEFGTRRLLSFDRDAVSGTATVQVAHDALLTRWPRLAAWIEDARDDLRTRRRLADAAADWVGSGRDPGFLLAGSRLGRYAAWAASTDLRLDTAERALLEASLQEQRRRDESDAARSIRERALELRAAGRLRALVAVLVAAVLVATSLSIALYGQGQSAREQAQIAVARERAAAAIGSLGTDPRLSLLLAWYAADATAEQGYVTEEAMDALHRALQASHVAYPADETAVAVRHGPGGDVGVPLIAPERLMAIAARVTGRALSDDECRSFLHVTPCPDPPATAAPARSLAIRTSSGVVPVERLASASLAGTHVEVVAQLPVDVAAFVAPFEARTGIDLGWTADTSTMLDERVAKGDLPDLAIVARPFTVADLARAGLLVDLSGVVDVAGLRATGGDYLVGLDTLSSADGQPLAAVGLYGEPWTTEAESLIWYPKAAFERAGYAVPRSWDDLQRLTGQMIADGRTPWCLGVAGGEVGGRSAVGFVEDAVLGTGGPSVYDEWAARTITFDASAPMSGFDRLARIAFTPGAVAGGIGSAIRTPPAIASWPMSDDPPSCWLYLGGGLDRLTFRSGRAADMTAFPVPAGDSRYDGMVRGRVFTIVVFHDRPEVRRLAATLMAGDLGDEVSAALAAGGLSRVGVQGGAGSEAALLATAQRAGTFRVSASDLVPSGASAAFSRGVAQFLVDGFGSLGLVVAGINDSWARPTEGLAGG